MIAAGIKVKQGPLNKGKEMRGKGDKSEAQHTTLCPHTWRKFPLCQMLNFFSKDFPNNPHLYRIKVLPRNTE